MTDMRRTLLWVVFSMSLLFIYDAWNKHNGRPSMFNPPAATKPAANGASPSPAAAGVGSLPTPIASAAVAGASAPLSGTAPLAAERVDITTDVIKATLDSTGGSLVRVELLTQADPNDASKNVLLFDQGATRHYVAQTGLLHPQSGAILPNHATVMRVLPGERSFKPGVNEVQVQFESPEAGGIKLIKTYTFPRGEHVIKVKHEVVNTAAAPVNAQLYFQLVRDSTPPPGESSFYFTFTGPAFHTDALKKLNKVEFSDIEKGKIPSIPSSDNGWVAMVQHYFASAWLLGAHSEEKLTRDYFIRKVEGTSWYSIGMITPLPTLQPGASKVIEARLFVGPQEETKLEALAPGLELVKDYGLFTVLSKPLFWLLTQLHKWLNNWGWAIVALVVLLKVAFYWLNASAYRSQAKMKAVNPRIMEMRERLKDKPQQMQQEMMRIYREEKVNPLGGCLPMLVQMPFFFALYWVLLASVEMRNAPWIGWITDLSARDPYFILPLLMTATSVLTTWLGPRPPDPMQARMMWIMPLVFSVTFFFFPAGLVLYWLTNNVLSIAQQWLINKQLGVSSK